VKINNLSFSRGVSSIALFAYSIRSAKL